MGQLHCGQLRFQRFGKHAVVVDADDGNILADSQSTTCRTFIHIPRARIVETEETVGIAFIEQLIDGAQRRTIMEYIAHQRRIVGKTGILQCRLISSKTTVLRNHVFRTSEIGDPLTIGLDQPFRGIVGDLEFVWLDAGYLVVGIGGIHHHHRIIAEGCRHGRNAVRHLRIEETVHAIPFQCGYFILFACLAIGADRDDHISVGACRILRTQNDAACIRGGGDFFADETENSCAAGA